MKKKLSRKEKESMLSYVRERFGLDKSVLKGLALFKTQRKIYITTQDCLNDPLFGRAETAGLAFLRPNKVLKPTTDFLQVFGKHATKNYVELSKEDAERFMRGEELDAREELNQGYIIIRYKGHILGCASFKEGTLKNQLPRSRRSRVKEL